jgi:hypothetical protein
MRGVRRSPLRLYWVETPDHHEDWFVIARTVGEAKEFFEDEEGYDDHEASAHVVAHLRRSSSRRQDPIGPRRRSAHSTRRAGRRTNTSKLAVASTC